MIWALSLLAAFPTVIAPQGTPTAPTTEGLVSNLPVRSLGPATMGGRVTDLAVFEKQPRIFLVASASGGVWRTDNAGITFNPVFEREGSSNVGAVAISQLDSNLIWVGTGEATSRNSSGWGDGIYKTLNGGKTWKNMGLPRSYHFSHILIDPKDNNTVYAGVLGNLWGPNPERGVYKTTDGGRTWTRVLFIDEQTGIGDLVMDPGDNHTLLAAAWERSRKPYSFKSGGPSSGLFKSTDGGRTWRRLIKGLPPSPLGRIGLSYFRKDPRIVLASVEAKEVGLFKSTDGGENWKRISKLNPRPFYFSLPRQDPGDINRIYLGAVSLYQSKDGGKTFEPMSSSVHVDHHAMWIDPNDSNHIIIGEDGGAAQSRDRGETWEHLNSITIGQFYAATFDMRKPYWVYGGLQDNGSWAGPTQTKAAGVAWYDFYGIGGGDGFHVQVDPEDWTTVYSESQGGDLVRIDQHYGYTSSIKPQPPAKEVYRDNWSTPFLISPHNPKTLYFGANKLLKSTNRGDTWNVISPDLTLNNPAWQKGNAESVVKEDTGAETHDTIITVSESPTKPGMLWVGTDDGQVQVTDDDGGHWKNVTANIKGLPANTWCSRVVASRFSEGRAYATFDGHRGNDFSTYCYVTEDFGKSWSSLAASLPNSEPCYVIKEGLKNPDLLFLGTEKSLYISIDRGATWQRYRGSGFPTVPVYDLEIHPREEDLLIATHGRSLYIMPVGALEELSQDNLKQDVYFAKPGNIYFFGRTTDRPWAGNRDSYSPNTQPGTVFCYYLKKSSAQNPKITVTDAGGSRTLTTLEGTPKAGLNTVPWTVRGRQRALPPGDYRAVLSVGGRDYASSVHVEDAAAP